MFDVLSCEVVEIGFMNELPPVPEGRRGRKRERERERERERGGMKERGR